MGAHAKLSPSASGTWMTCPGAIPLVEKLGIKGEDSVYASMGTAMHTVSEACLRLNRDAASFIGREVDGHVITEAMADTCQTFINYVRSIPGIAMYEQRLKIPVVNNCWGTADVIKIDKTHLHVVDLKTGAGVPVDAHENTQGLCYSLGAFDAFKVIEDIETITFTIVQPPLNSISSFTFGLDRLQQFLNELIEAEKKIEVARLVLKQNDIDSQQAKKWFNPSQKACRFCAAKLHCPAQKDLALEAAKQDFAAFKSEDFGFWMQKIPVIEDFIKAVKDRVEKDLLSGKRVSGFKLVEGRKTRVWVDAVEAAKKLVEQFPDFADALVPKVEPQLVSPPQAETILKKQDFDLDSLIRKLPGKPTVAPESDRRSNIDANSSARRDFAE